jgi:tripartite-type tricarboxylate transporter receptor subunit TctC
MRISRSTLIKIAASAFFPLTLTSVDTAAQAYPSRPIRILVPLSVGSQTDIVARLVAQKLNEHWAQPVIVDNRTGAAGGIAGGILVKSAPDGHTLMIYSDGHAVNAALNAEKLPFDTLRDIARVSLVATFPSILVVAPSLGVKTLKEFIALAKSRPGQFNFGSAGIGGGLHFSGELFKVAAGLDAVHIPFKGTPEALAEVMAGRIQFTFTSPGPAMALIRDGRLLPLSVASPQRSPAFPDVPTAAEAGLRGFEYELWQGLFAPAGTPRAVVAKLNREVTRIMSLAGVKDILLKQAVVHRPNSPDEFDHFVRKEIDKLRNVIRVAGIKSN